MKIALSPLEKIRAAGKFLDGLVTEGAQHHGIHELAEGTGNVRQALAIA